jgi:CO dehydrogenase/acetyl-CoA synthase epsilon subunit
LPLSLLSPPLQAMIPTTTTPITTVPTSILGYRKELINAAKLYTDDQKYSGISGNFNFKLTIFYNICKRADVLKRVYPKAFLLMLQGLALNYYYNAKLAIFIFENTYKSLYSFFRGPNSKHKSLNK